jgi:hypothetical protein
VRPNRNNKHNKYVGCRLIRRHSTLSHLFCTQASLSLPYILHIETITAIGLGLSPLMPHSPFCRCQWTALPHRSQIVCIFDVTQGSRQSPSLSTCSAHSPYVNRAMIVWVTRWKPENSKRPCNGIFWVTGVSSRSKQYETKHSPSIVPLVLHTALSAIAGHNLKVYAFDVTKRSRQSPSLSHVFCTQPLMSVPCICTS